MEIKVYLLIIITVKVLLTKGLYLVFILLSFALKGKELRKDEAKWNDYFIKLPESFVVKYAICIYMFATILSSLVSYALFLIFKFQNPLSLTVILFVACMIISWCKYRMKGKEEIVQAVYKVHQSAILNNGND